MLADVSSVSPSLGQSSYKLLQVLWPDLIVTRFLFHTLYGSTKNILLESLFNYDQHDTIRHLPVRNSDSNSTIPQITFMMDSELSCQPVVPPKTSNLLAFSYNAVTFIDGSLPLTTRTRIGCKLRAQ